MGRVQYLEGQLPLFVPETTWTCPKELPDLSNVSEIAIDTETRDDGLAAGRGPGWRVGIGYIAGVSVAWGQNKLYIPIKHPDTECFDFDQVGAWLSDLFKQDHTTFVAHNFNYDGGYIQKEWGIKPPKKIDDTNALAVMIDENRLSYSLDNLCAWQGLPGKNETLMNEAAAAYGFAKNVKANLWKLPARFVGTYAEDDAAQTLALAKKLRPEIIKQEMQEAYQVEAKLIPLILEMCRRGIRVDLDKAEQSRDYLIKRRNQALIDLGVNLSQTIGWNKKVGMEEINSARKIEEWFNLAKIPFARTEKSLQGKFDSEFLEKHEHWLPKSISLIRQLENAQSKFLQGFIIDYSHKSRLHASINQFRGEEGGTKTHRMSISDPPLQQMSSRDSTPLKGEIASIVRGCFLPEVGETFAAADLSQQEYRLLVHYAELLNLRKAKETGDKYRSDPKTDFHEYVASVTGLPRKRAKDCNFATVYGASARRFAEMANISVEEAEGILTEYDKEFPFAKQAGEFCKRRAEQKGYLKLIDGARSHFDSWEPARRDWDLEKQYRGQEGVAPCYLEDAQRRMNDPSHPWKGRLVRSFTFKALNRLIQSSAARQIKKAMLGCWEEGLVPLLQIHDELDFSFHSESQGKQVQQIMCDAIKLTIPMVCDIEYGTSWGSAKKIETKDKQALYNATWEEAQRLKVEGKWW